MTQPSSARPLSVLIVDDEPLQLEALRMCIDDEHDVAEAESPEAALALVSDQLFDLALVDLRLGAHSGLDLVPRLLSAAPWLKVVFLTAHATVETAVQAMRLGAVDYLTKPVDPQAVRVLVERLAAARRLERQVASLEDDAERAGPPPLLQSRNPAMRRVYELAHRVAPSEAMVLIRGESGTGKGVLAREIHRLSDRSDEIFSVINCPSLSAELLQSELFGHVKGAFTGAVRSQVGKVELCAGGTLFLDEIGDLPGSIQPKLLRFVQERMYERVGDPRPREADVRIISATNRDLETAVAEGEFREDLLYRLNVIEMVVPPLRERPEDLEDLANGFLRFFAQKYNRKIHGYSEAAWNHVMASPWPGNVRELQNAIERAVILCDTNTIPRALLPNVAPPAANGAETAGVSPAGGSRLESLEEVEARHIAFVLENTDSIEDAAETLGIAPSTLWRKRRKFGL